MAAVDAVMFDFGGVISDNPFSSMGRLASALGIEPAEFAAIAVGFDDYGAGDHPWHQLERGEIGVEEFNRATDELARGRGLEGFPPLPVKSILAGISDVRGPMLELMAELRTRGIRTAIVTNNVRVLNAWRQLADWDQLVDAVVDSCEVGMRKPEPRIFEHVAQLLGVELSNAVLLDDMQANIDGAVSAGMTGILVTDPDAAIKELNAVISA